jgi:predicted Zn-dependent protease with MMP-like domain
MAYHVSKERFTELVRQAVESLPAQFREFLEEVPIEIRDRPTPSQLRSLKLKKNDLLLGLYVGRPRTERSVLDSASVPDVIFIFQEDVELVSDSEEQLVQEVRTTVLHEIGHHFGMSEDDLEKLGYG